MSVHHPRGQRALRRGRVSIPGQAYALAMATAGRRPLLAALAPARIVVSTMRGLGESGVVESLAFVVMPDHVHWLVQLRAAPLPDVVRLLKGRSARRLGIECGAAAPVWQRGYFDRAVRGEEAVRIAARYIILNPVRAGLAPSIGAFPHWDCRWPIADAADL